MSQDNAQIFATDAQILFRIIGGLRQSSRIPASRVTVVLADDFARAVEQHYRPHAGEEQPPSGWFSSERLAGKAAAKCLGKTGDAATMTIVFDSEQWQRADESPLRAEGMVYLAHEFAHVVINRARHVSGAMAGVTLPSARDRLRTVWRLGSRRRRRSSPSRRFHWRPRPGQGRRGRRRSPRTARDPR